MVYRQASNDQYSLTLAPLIVELGAQLGAQLGADAQGVPVPCCCSSCPTCCLISHEDEMVPIHPSEAGIHTPDAAELLFSYC